METRPDESLVFCPSRLVSNGLINAVCRTRGSSLSQKAAETIHHLDEWPAHPYVHHEIPSLKGHGLTLKRSPPPRTLRVTMRPAQGTSRYTRGGQKERKRIKFDSIQGTPGEA